MVESILDCIGNTPMVKIARLNRNPNVEIYAKLECQNPSGSLKDRIALCMISKAEQEGKLAKGKTVLEATSGNNGISLAMICAVKGYRLIVVMSESETEEWRKTVSAFGAELILTPAGEGSDDAIRKVEAMVAAEPGKYYVPYQYGNPNNVLAHFEATGKEIWEQTNGRVTHLVAGIGTGGTLMGAGGFLKSKNRSIKIIGVEPENKIHGLRNLSRRMVPPIFKAEAVDERVLVSEPDALNQARELAQKEGLLVGPSSGAVMHAALAKANELKGGVIVAIFADRGDRYLSAKGLP